PGPRRSLRDANRPSLTLAGAAPALRRAHTFVWFYSGNHDHFFKQNAAFATALTQAGIAHRFFVVRGGHNWALWRGNASRALLAASRRLVGAAGRNAAGCGADARGVCRRSARH